MQAIPRSVLEAHQVLVEGEPPWRQRLRLLQALWREEQGLPIGQHERGGYARPLGSRIAMPGAQQQLSNYLTDTIREIVRAELDDPHAKALGKLYAAPRVYDDLLSSQPMCFNLFGELKADLDLAGDVARHLWPDRVESVTRIEFEHSPGRGDPTYTANRSAFDVYLEHTHPAGGKGFIGIEVKYHEDLKVGAAENRKRTDEVALQSGVFIAERFEELRRPPLQQVWFDHLLALSMVQAGGWTSGLFVFLHPVANERCYRVINSYQQTLLSADTFQRLTLEEFVAALRLSTTQQWVRDFNRRYLEYDRAID